MAYVRTRTCGILAATCLIAATSGAGPRQENQRTMGVRDRRVVLDTGDSLLGPCVLKSPDGYRMWYTAVARPGKDDPLLRGCPWLAGLSHIWETHYATSADGITWTKHGVLMDTKQPGTPGQLRVYDPWFLDDEHGQWRLWYIGKGADGVRRICHAWWDSLPQ